jgi:hypothetical protein
MISELKAAFEKAGALSDADQRVIAELIMDELNWDQTFKKSQKQLSSLAGEAVEEYKKGATKPLDL